MEALRIEPGVLPGPVSGAGLVGSALRDVAWGARDVS